MKIDLHSHSKHSKRPTLWFMQKLGCPESFTEPLHLYELCRKKGMSAVTITDHNTIDGALEIAHLDGAFIGCEYTTYFPEDRCKVHVLVYEQTEAQHRDLMQVRDNIYNLVKYVHHHELPHICAHPLFGPNELLSVEHVEKLLLLFKNWEWNGDRNPEQNMAMQLLLHMLTPEDYQRLADKHGIEPPVDEVWKKNITSGSDDHSSLNLAAAFTEVTGAETLKTFWEGIEKGHAKIRCQPATPLMFSRNVYGIAYQFYKSKFGVERHVNKDVFLRFLDRVLHSRIEPAEPWLTRVQAGFVRRWRSSRKANPETSLLNLARVEAEKHIWSDPQLMAIVKEGVHRGANLDQKWFEFVNEVCNRALVHVGHRMLDRVARAYLLGIFDTVGMGGMLYTLLAPYFVAFSLYTKERQFSNEVLDHFLGERRPSGFLKKPTRVAHFTDTLNDVNGVARTIQQQLKLALQSDKDYTVITAAAKPQPFERGVHYFTSVGALELPEYPELKLLCPPFLEMLNHCFEEGYTHLHAATPGPVGLAALGIARILKLPISGTYHTALPQYAKALTDDAYVEEMMWRSMVWFYEQMDYVYVPSRATAEELLDKGLNPEKIRVYPRGVDTERFHSSKKCRDMAARFSLDDGRVNILYVGRVSKEKNLHVLAEAYCKLIDEGVDARLIITGDGPYRQEMESILADTPALFTGYLEGEDLPALYATCDFFVFPSTTDTFGNVVLEAQACGIPVIVTDRGGPCENILEDETGLVVEGNSIDALASGMKALSTKREMRQAMGAAARLYMETRSFERAFDQLWTMYTGDQPEPSDTDEFQHLADSLRGLAAQVS